MLRFARNILVLLSFSLASGAFAQDVRISPETATRSFELAGQTVTISRIQNQDFELTGEFARTSRACPPSCIQPMSVDASVQTLGELEVIDFLADKVAAGQAILIDARLPQWYAQGSIPGAINVPDTTLAPENPYRGEILKALGATETDGKWDFSNSVELGFFSNGAWSEEPVMAIRDLLEFGYPGEKLKYYRGGMQTWLLMGLTAAAP